jgi:multidrug efflux pump subunit AcrB
MQAKGNFDGPHQDYQINANDQLVTSDDYRKVVVAYRNGAPIMLTMLRRWWTASRTTSRRRG